jgi:hypothetical protein
MDNEISFGAFKSPVDYRDIGLATVSEPKDYPQSFMLDVSKLPVWHQRKIGACVGHAAAKYKQFLDLGDIKAVSPLSARFVYALAKSKDGVPDQEGTYPRVAAKILKEIGCATEGTVQNNTNLTHADYINLSNIPKSAYDEAYKAKIAGYAFVDITCTGLKQAIVDFGGAMLLLRLGSEWWTNEFGNSSWDAGDVLPVRPPEDIISGHEVYLCGYEDLGYDTRFYFMNSWSDQWGDKGIGYFHWDEYKKFIDEGITFTDIPNTLLEEAHSLPEKFSHKFMVVMKYGNSSEEVKWLQRALKQLGFFNYSITGNYYDITQAAVYEFQKKNVSLSWYERYIMRGKQVGQKTLDALNKLLGVI